MPVNKQVAVSKLSLDLGNFRTVPQPDETHAIQAMISISPDRFWALMESMLDDGYLPTENIIVLDASDALVVKEGNRRVAALKLIHSLVPTATLEVPSSVTERMQAVTAQWLEENASVPCAIFPVSQAAIVDRIVTLAHGKGEKAGRDNWNAVARARHNRSSNGPMEPALDLLEKYLVLGTNLTPQQAAKWSGEYPLTVLEEALKRLAPRLGAVSAADLAKSYPNVAHRKAVEDILQHIGVQIIGFPVIRDKNNDFGQKYGIPPSGPPAAVNVPLPATPPSLPGPLDASPPPVTSSRSGQSPSAPPTTAPPRKIAAVATNDPRAVIRTLRKFKPIGLKREKVVTLRNEATQLKLEKNPLAFCFLLRSMFEISAKAYCDDHAATGGPIATKSDGTDRRLVDILRDVAKHLTKGGKDKAIERELHGAMAELGKSDSPLSVTSMNQLVHHATFSVNATDISTLFFNVYPLLQAMNR